MKLANVGVMKLVREAAQRQLHMQACKRMKRQVNPSHPTKVRFRPFFLNKIKMLSIAPMMDWTETSIFSTS